MPMQKTCFFALLSAFLLLITVAGSVRSAGESSIYVELEIIPGTAVAQHEETTYSRFLMRPRVGRPEEAVESTHVNVDVEWPSIAVAHISAGVDADQYIQAAVARDILRGDMVKLRCWGDERKRMRRDQQRRQIMKDRRVSRSRRAQIMQSSSRHHVLLLHPRSMNDQERRRLLLTCTRPPAPTSSSRAVAFHHQNEQRQDESGEIVLLYGTMQSVSIWADDINVQQYNWSWAFLVLHPAFFLHLALAFFLLSFLAGLLYLVLDKTS